MPEVIIKNVMDNKILLKLQDYTSLEITIKQLKDDIFDAKGLHVQVVQIDQTSTFEDSDTLQKILDREKERQQNDLVNKRAQLSVLVNKRDALPPYGPSSEVKKRFTIDKKIRDLKRDILTFKRPQTEDSVTVKVRERSPFKQFA